MKIRLIDASETFVIRQKVLWPDLPIENCMLSDDNNGIHIGAFDGGTLIAAASVFKDHDQYRLRKFAILPENQRQGVGADMLIYICNMLQEMDAKLLWLDARATAIKFYEKLGFEQIGTTFFKRDVLYVKMQRTLTILP